MQDGIVIDTDPGVDDALALVFSSLANLNVTAVTTVYGNASLANTTRNAGYIIKSLGSSWSLHEGASHPLAQTAHLAKSHGVTGLGDVTPTDDQIALPSPRPASDVLRNLEDNTTSTIFCLGPLTNLATAFADNSDIAKKINKLVIMGGAFTEKGNVTEYAEFNVYNDPKAFSEVIAYASEHAIDTTIIPAEVCRKVVLTTDDLALLEKNELLPNLKSIVTPFIDYYVNKHGYVGAVLYDILVPLYYLQPDTFEYTEAKVSIELLDATRRGQTTFKPKVGSSVKVCTNINAAQAKHIVMSTFDRAAKHNSNL